MSKPPKVFTREATGLVRSLTARDAFLTSVFSVGYMWPLLYLYFAGATYEGVDLPQTVWLGLPIALAMGVAYYQLSAAFPRSGGDYVWVSRIVHPAIGFMSSFAFAAVWMSFVGTITGFFFLSSGLEPMFVNLGVVTGNSAYLNIAQSLAGLSTSEYLGFVVGLVIILLATSVGMLGQRATYRILLVTFGIVAVAIIVYCAALLSAGPSGFQSGFDRLSGTQYNSIISAADQAGLITTFTVQGTILGSVWTMLNYLGFSNSVYVAGEIKRNETSQLYGIIGGLAVFAVVMYALFAVSYYVMGGQFINAASLLSATGSADYALPSPPVGEYLVVFANQSPLVALLVPLGVMAGALGGMVVLFPIVTRTVFAWSFDRVVPTKFCEVNSRGAPTYSILISCVVGIIVLAATFFTSFSSFLLYTVSALWINVAIVGLTAMLFPLRSKMFQDAVPAARKKIGPVPVVSIAGLITLISGVAIAYVSVNPAYNMIPLDVPLLFVPISLFVIGLVIYFVSAAYRKHQGIDLSLTFKELPPE